MYTKFSMFYVLRLDLQPMYTLIIDKNDHSAFTAIFLNFVEYFRIGPTLRQ
jgi:hypothetical protein